MLPTSKVTMDTTKTIDLNYYLHQKNFLWNSLAILYTLGSYGVGIDLFLIPNNWINVLGVIVLAHSLVLSALLAHEFMHGNTFSNVYWNTVGGSLMLWLNGGCYTRFKDLVKMHIAHHVNRIDYCRFDLLTFLQSIPPPLRWGLLSLEWLYFPILAFLVRIYLILVPFWLPERKDERFRIILIFSIRVSLFIVLGLISFKALLLYFLAYISMIHVLRFMDAFQHTYESLSVGVSQPNHTPEFALHLTNIYEQANTFSNIISQKYWWLNLLLLNFGYHNAHHQFMKCPWYYLHKLDRELYPNTDTHYITLTELFGNYHRFRISRIFTGQGKAIDGERGSRIQEFYGAIEVSFLVVPAQMQQVRIESRA